MKISVVILTFNSQDFIEKCLNSVLEQSLSPDEIIIVDNNSKDNTINIIKEKFYNNKIIFLPQSFNTGFAKGMNIGIRASTGDYVLCLNADTYLDRDFLKYSIKYFIKYNNVGSITGKILRMDDNKKIDTVGNFLNLRFTLKNSKNTEKKEFIFGPNGCAPIFSRRFLDEICINNQYFDEQYFAFMEDTDINWRGQIFGYSSLFVPDAIVYHKRSASFDGKVSFFEKPLEIQYMVLKNRYRTLIKNLDFLSFFVISPLFIIEEFFVWSFLLLKSVKYVKFLVNIIDELIKEKDYLKLWKKEIYSKKKRSFFYILKFLRI